MIQILEQYQLPLEVTVAVSGPFQYYRPDIFPHIVSRRFSGKFSGSDILETRKSRYRI